MSSSGCCCCYCREDILRACDPPPVLLLFLCRPSYDAERSFWVSPLLWLFEAEEESLPRTFPDSSIWSRLGSPLWTILMRYPPPPDSLLPADPSSSFRFTLILNSSSEPIE